MQANQFLTEDGMMFFGWVGRDMKLMYRRMYSLHRLISYHRKLGNEDEARLYVRTFNTLVTRDGFNHCQTVSMNKHKAVQS